MKFNTLFVVLTVGSLALSACGASSTPSSSDGVSSSATSAPVVVPPTTAPTTNTPTALPATNAPIAAPAGAGTEVKISHFAFDPSTLEIKVGTTVTWTNEDGASHTVSADDGSFSSDTLQQGDSNAFTFNEAGSYSYHCDFHSGMKATITVTP